MHAFYNFSALQGQRQAKSFLVDDKEPLLLHNQYRESQVISHHGIEQVLTEYTSFGSFYTEPNLPW